MALTRSDTGFISESDTSCQDLSRSFHALEFIDSSVGGFTQRAAHHPAALRRRKSETELPVDDAVVFSLADEQQRAYQDSDRPVLRRRRFTRKQRKSVTIDPETSLILATGAQSTSSSDEEEHRSRSSSTRPSARLNKSRGLSASVNALAPKEEAKPEKKKSHPRGPAARRAGRRSALLKSQVAASTTNLDQLKTPSSQLRPERRSMSVRDLNGEEFDFSNKDSVTRWTSQILAELDSLPSSCVDLTRSEKIDNFSMFSGKIDRINRKNFVLDDNRKFSTLQMRSTAPPPPVPPHRKSMFESQQLIDKISTHNELMTSSVIEPMTSTFGSTSSSAVAAAPARSETDMTSSIDSVNSWISSFENLMTSSFQDVMRGSVYSTRSDRSASLTRDREDSNATTLVPLSSESEGEDGTPLALTPTPIEELPIPTSSDKSSSSEVMAVSLIVNSDELSQDPVLHNESSDPTKPIPARRTVLTERNSTQKTTAPTTLDRISASSGSGKSVQINGADQESNGYISSTMPRPKKEFNCEVSPVPVRRRQFADDALQETDTKLNASIARLSRSVYGSVNCDEPHPPALNRLSIPVIRTERWASEQSIDQSGTNDLEKWKKRCACHYAIALID
ncbi:hypothetical protein Y032_0160g3321 [Ancylostoma ceylanicum]|uniref:Uncharacterized protein n=1 Tax=Ancylostoma ceylanicum TaxID=53326 RepID=A0A016SY29_9BILA|nr:hypothetical protein Y032_0160g3321 [Ancylostoma ceylanicum]